MNVFEELLKYSELQLARRQFVKGVAVGSALLGLGSIPSRLLASMAPSTHSMLQGTKFDLYLSPQKVNFTGRERLATTVNGLVPGPILRWREGDRVTLSVTNNLAEQSSLHWHGIILPMEMDGVPGISFKGIDPGETYHYTFNVRQSGTYWYHSHSGFQEQTGMYGGIIIDPMHAEPFSYDREYVIILSDWSDEEPGSIYAKLKKLSHYYNFNERTVGDFVREIREKGGIQAWSERVMWNMMRMSDRDLSDVTGYTYTFLMNGQSPASGWTGLFNKGERVRLRFVNSSAMTSFDVRVPDLALRVVAADGQNVEPVTVDEFRIGVAETYDVIVEPRDDRAYCIFAQALDRTGFARGVLTPDPSLTADIPALDPYPILTHVDMGMAMGGTANDLEIEHETMANMKNSPHSMPSLHAMGKNMPPGHSMGPQSSDRTVVKGTGQIGHGSAAEVIHGPAEFGPHVDGRAQAPQYRIDDPGVGLRNNGRRVLTYVDLRNLYPTPDPRDPGREIQLHLTGNMARYMWSINGVKYSDAEPLGFRFGERIRITFVNDTMMNHPMHLHGMWSDLETGDGQHIPRKHTILVQPGAKISYLVTADAMGDWAFHCHLLYHMMAMFRRVEVR